jgi:glycosyltransferase involved in cell wall biosynthesis
VHQRGGDDRALAAAFREAALFVYPSLCEGFGLPVLEAMSAGCPVAVAEGTGALTEVAGDAAFRFDALNPESLAHLLDTVLPDADWRDRMRVAGTRRCLDFGWDRCAEGTSAVYRRLV